LRRRLVTDELTAERARAARREERIAFMRSVPVITVAAHIAELEAQRTAQLTASAAVSAAAADTAADSTAVASETSNSAFAPAKSMFLSAEEYDEI
jgi:hypothetical protein